MSIYTDFPRVRIPFTSYDVFGYVIPGTILLVAIYLFEVWARHEIGTSCHTPIYTILKQARTIVFSQDWVLSIFLIFIFLIIAYAIGHLIATLSSLVLDRILIYKGYGYPYKFLLNIKSKKNLQHPIRKPYYRGMFFWLNFYIILRYVNFSFLSNVTIIHDIADGLGWFLLSCLFAKIIGSHIRAHPKGRIYRFFYPGKGRHIRNAYKWFNVRIFAAIYDGITNTLSSYIDSRKAFDEKFIEKYRECFIKNFGLDPNESSTNNYWLSYCYVVDNSQTFNSMLANWLHLYAFSRNLSTALYIAFIYGFISLRFQINSLSNSNLVLILLPILFFLASLLMLTRYYYLYVLYYSKFLFRSFVYLNSKKEMLTKRDLTELNRNNRGKDERQ